MSKKITVAVLGAGNMGTALAQVAGSNGYAVKLWNHEGDPEPLKQIAEFGENKKYLSGIALSKNIKPEPDLKKALAGADIVITAIPSNFMSGIIKKIAGFLKKKAIVVDISKGLDDKNLEMIPEIMFRQLAGREIASLSGPSIARDVAKGDFTAMNLVATSPSAIREIKKVLENKNFKIIPSSDFTGVELAGSFKNVYAIAMGLCDGLGYSINTKAALLVNALKELARLIKKMGGKQETVYDLAGLGDMVGTGLCAISRNRRFGEYLAQGLSKEDALKKVEQVVEGIKASETLHRLSKKVKTKLPLAEAVYEAVCCHRPPKITLENYLKNSFK